jgi:hypothetical protein
MMGVYRYFALPQRFSQAIRTWNSLTGCRASRSFSASSRSNILSQNVGLKNSLKISEEVRDALATDKPVVALETTIYTHGALGDDLDLEGIVRRNGGVPAVVGIYGGVPTVGLTPEQIVTMVENSPRKASRRDIAHLVGMVRPQGHETRMLLLNGCTNA